MPLPTLAAPATETPLAPSATLTPPAPSSPTDTPFPTVTPVDTRSPAPVDPAAAAAWARDQAWAHLLAEYPDDRLPDEPNWEEAGVQAGIGSGEYRFRDGDWLLAVSVPVTAPETRVFLLQLEGPDRYAWQATVRTPGQTGPIVSAGEPIVRPLTEVVEGWGGTIHSLPRTAEFDDYFRVAGGAGGQYGIRGATSDAEERIALLRDSHRIVMVWGTLHHDADDYGGGQLVVVRLDGAGSEGTSVPTAVAQATTSPTESPATETVAMPAPASATRAPASQIVEGWVGVVRKLPDGSRHDDYFDAQEPGGQYGIAALLAPLAEELANHAANGTPIRVWGVVDYGVDDYGGARILVARLEPLG